jgi:mannose-1-phosphate guanylyltransferase
LPASTNSSTTDPNLRVVILAGGVGSRFWPASTSSRPKQLLPLAGERPLIRETRDRLAGLVPPERIHLLAGRDLGARLLAALPDLDERNLLAEPAARGTGPVLAWASHEIARRDPEAVLVSLHADHAVEPAAAFREQLARVAALAREHERLFTIGAPPDRPETGFGYIRRGAPLPGADDAYRVERFVEKPGADAAARYLADGSYLWNTGIFVWPVRLFLEEVRKHSPEIGPHLDLLDAGDVDAFFGAVTPVSVDVGVLERSAKVAVSPARFAWDDVGSWEALGRTARADARGNVAIGPAHVVEADGCVAWAEGGAIVAWGVRDLVIVHRPGVTLVMPRERAPHLKDLLARLPSEIAERADHGGTGGEHG